MATLRTVEEIIATVRALDAADEPVLIEAAEVLRLVAEIDRLRAQDADARELLQATVSALTVPAVADPRDLEKWLTYIATRAAAVCGVLSLTDSYSDGTTVGFPYIAMTDGLTSGFCRPDVPPPYAVREP